MARTEVNIIRTSRLQVYPYTSADQVAGNIVDGMQVAFNNGATLLQVESASGAPQTVSILLVETVDFQPAGPVVLTIPANSSTLLGPFPPNLYGNVLEFDTSSASLSFLAFTLV